MPVTLCRAVVVWLLCAVPGAGCRHETAHKTPPAPNKPVTDNPAAKTSAAKTPAAKQPAAKQPTAKQPATKRTSAPKPLPKVSTTPRRSFPPGTLAHVGSPRPREIWSLAVSPDGKNVVAGCADGTLRLWDLRTRTPGATYWADGLHVSDVSVSPNGRRLVSFSPNTDTGVLVWDAHRFVPLRRLPGKAPATLAWGSKGRWLALGWRYPQPRLQLVDPNTGANGVAMALPNKNSLNFVLATPDGERVLAGQGGEVQIWAAKSGKLEGTHDLANSSVAYLGALSADGRLLAVMGGGHEYDEEERPMVYLMDLNKRAWLGHLPHRQAAITALALAPDGQTLVAAAGKRLLVWRTDAPQPIPEPEEEHDGYGDPPPKKKKQPAIPPAARPRQLRHAAPVTALAFSPSSLAFLAADEQGQVRLWELALRRPRGAAPRATEAARWHVWGKGRQGHDAPVSAVALSADGKELWTRAGKRTLRWDLATRKLLRGGRMVAMEVASCNTLVRGALRREMPPKLRRRMVKACKNLECIDGDCPAERAQPHVWVSANRKVVVAEDDDYWRNDDGAEENMLEVWSAGRRRAHRLEFDAAGNNVLTLSRDGGLIALWDRMKHKAELYDLTRDKATRTCAVASKAVDNTPDAAAFSPDGKRFAAASYGGVTVWRVSGCVELETVNTGSSSLTALSFSADRRTLAAGLSDGTALTLKLSK
jgi:WD40 repeat protein